MPYLELVILWLYKQFLRSNLLGFRKSLTLIPLILRLNISFPSWHHSPNTAGYSLDKGLIKHHDKIWIGNNSATQTKLINAFHSSAIGGHSGVAATYQRLKRLFSWKGLKQDVDNFVKQCQVCQQAKHPHTHPAGLLQPLPIPTGVWQDISMDSVEGLPKSEGYSVILVVVDRFTKYAHFIPIKHPYTAQIIARWFWTTLSNFMAYPRQW